MEKLAQWKEAKKKLKLTNQDISNLSGIPLRTIEPIMCGKVKSPRIDTVEAIERALGLSPTTFNDEDYANGVTDEAKILVNVRQYKWLELGDEIFQTKGKEYYNALVQTLEGVIKQK